MVTQAYGLVNLQDDAHHLKHGNGLLTPERIRALIFEQYGSALKLDGVPRPFSSEFFALPIPDLRRRAALVRASLAWWSGVPSEEAVQREIAWRMAEASRAVSELWPEANARHRLYQQFLRARRAA